jgi:hypothetical protein
VLWLVMERIADETFRFSHVIILGSCHVNVLLRLKMLCIPYIHNTGREQHGPHSHIVDVHRNIYWGILAPHGQSPHSTSNVLLGSYFGIH